MPKTRTPCVLHNADLLRSLDRPAARYAMAIDGAGRGSARGLPRGVQSVAGDPKMASDGDPVSHDKIARSEKPRTRVNGSSRHPNISVVCRLQEQAILALGDADPERLCAPGY